MKHIDTIIVGGGISGISLAHQLSQSDIEHCIIEQNHIGGCIDTVEYESIWFEMGAHTIYNSYSNTIKFIESRNLQKHIVSRKKLPFLFVQPNNKIQSVFKNLNFIALAFSFLKNKNTPKKNKTVKEYAEKVFGKTNYAKTLKYCFNAVLSQDSSNFPMEYLFKKYDRDTSLPRSFTLKGGLSELFKNHKQVIIRETVLQLYKENDKWLVKTNNNQYSCNKLCIATPWNITASLLENTHYDIANHQYAPKMSNLTSIGIVLNKKKIQHIKNLAGLIGKEQFFYSAVSRDVIPNPDLRAIVFHCHEKTSKEKLIEKISNLLDIEQKDILYSNIKNNSLPCYHRNHNVFIEDLNKSLDSTPNLFISGNFFDRLAIENCIRRSNREFKRLLKYHAKDNS